MHIESFVDGLYAQAGEENSRWSAKPYALALTLQPTGAGIEEQWWLAEYLQLYASAR